jgi:hypothetical protein
VRYMVMHYQTQAMEDGVKPTPEMQAAIGQYMEESAMAGVRASLRAQQAPGSRSPTAGCESSTAPTPKPRN